jgi:hypothetical protein
LLPLFKSVSKRFWQFRDAESLIIAKETDLTTEPPQDEGYNPLVLPEYDIEQYVVPVLNALPDRSARLHGTAFFINGSGTLLTAGHVMKNAQDDAGKTGERVCIVIRTPGTNEGNSYGVLAADFAPPPFDIAIGTTNAVSRSFVRLANATARAALRDVMTFGYPESAQVPMPSGGIVLGCRAHKGHIVRLLPPGQLLTHPHPAAIELSFPIPSALSGAPLVLERPATALERALMSAPGVVPAIGLAARRSSNYSAACPPFTWHLCRYDAGRDGRLCS